MTRSVAVVLAVGSTKAFLAFWLVNIVCLLADIATPVAMVTWSAIAAGTLLCGLWACQSGLRSSLPADNLNIETERRQCETTLSGCVSVAGSAAGVYWMLVGMLYLTASDTPSATGVYYDLQAGVICLSFGLVLLGYALYRSGVLIYSTSHSAA